MAGVLVSLMAAFCIDMRRFGVLCLFITCVLYVHYSTCLLLLLFSSDC